MIRDITLGQYFPGNSVVHRIDPRAKILLTLLNIVVLFFVRDLYGFLLYFLFTAGVVWLSHIPLRYMVKGLKPIVVIILITAVLNLFMTPGEQEIFHFYFLRLTWEGVYMATFMVVRIVLLLLLTSLLTYTTPPLLLTDGIERLLAPYRKIGIPAHEIAMMMTIALRFIPTLLEETDKIMKAQKARGADFESGNLIRRAKSMIPILIPLFVSAFKRADDLALAMESRCYTGGEGRTRMKQLHFSKVDLIAALVVLLICTACILV